MDLEEYKWQVSTFLAFMRDPTQEFLGTEYCLVLGKENVLETHCDQPFWGDFGIYTTKLMATSTTNTKVLLNIVLLEQLSEVMRSGQGWSLQFEGVQYEFVVEKETPTSFSTRSFKGDPSEAQSVAPVNPISRHRLEFRLKSRSSGPGNGTDAAQLRSTSANYGPTSSTYHVGYSAHGLSPPDLAAPPSPLFRINSPNHTPISPLLLGAASSPKGSMRRASVTPDGSESGDVKVKLKTEPGKSQGKAREQAE
jgi:hypothetical protein